MVQYAIQWTDSDGEEHSAVFRTKSDAVERWQEIDQNNKLTPRDTDFLITVME